MGQIVHIEIEILVGKPTLFHNEECVGHWCWAMSYSPTKEESIGFNALLSEGMRPIPQNLTKEVQKKMDTWKHQETYSWLYLTDILGSLEETVIPFSVRNWFISWASEHLALLGNPSQFRVIIWITEGMYD